MAVRKTKRKVVKKTVRKPVRKTRRATKKKTTKQSPKTAKVCKEHECHVVKLSGEHEHYNPLKVWKSVYNACYVVHKEHKKCEEIADKVTAKVNSIIKRKKEMHSQELLKVISKELHKIDKHIKFMYKEHMDIN